MQTTSSCKFLALIRLSEITRLYLLIKIKSKSLKIWKLRDDLRVQGFKDTYDPTLQRFNRKMKIKTFDIIVGNKIKMRKHLISMKVITKGYFCSTEKKILPFKVKFDVFESIITHWNAFHRLPRVNTLNEICPCFESVKRKENSYVFVWKFKYLRALLSFSKE